MPVARLNETSSQRVASSFRDPSGYVFRREDRIFRAVDDACWRLLNELATEGTLGTLVDRGMIVPTTFVQEPKLVDALRLEHSGDRHFFEHQPVAPITYPYEWSISMLADAGIHTIDLQLNLLSQRCSLKDASAYNVQFRAGRPVFIDVSSIERSRRPDVWPALGQFNQMFTFGVLLARHYGWDPRSYFLAEPGGRSVEQMARMFGPVERWRGRLLWDVTLPHLLRPRPGKNRRPGRSPPAGDAAQRWNLSRLRKKLRRMADSYRPRGAWTRYADRCHYRPSDQRLKHEAVAEFLKHRRPKTVIDLGCNSGDYSFLAARLGASVTAIDKDHDTIEVLYRRLKQQPARITPVVADMTNPSPGVGFRNREWPGLLTRMEGECVLALALVHHFLVTGNLPPAAIRDLLCDVTGRYLVAEYVPPSDRMFQELVGQRTASFGWLSLELFKRVFCERFSLLHEVRLSDGGRTLLFFEKDS